ncbi:hypothetical protein [Actinophytocola oryzae]|uniref:Uncharacterized protein n=1 Tax=Actinophytocola oryzae TaxID=502181 RepID=A0A4R7V3W8_9PSEU|nr:hypothetical protein [Actinophytocola oryzae]TDV42176.1 hypothetical protein CLV71_11846 [Actinophytocola oryzae]
MSLLTRIRGRAGFGRTRIGAAVVVHAADGVTDEARALAESLPADPEHELVVADVPPVSAIDVWQSFAAALPRGRRSLRVVPGQEPREIAPYVWQWLADRLGRGVLAPYGLTQNRAGTLFVHSIDQSGWVSFGKGKAPAWTGKRFPQPVWDTIEVSQVRSAGFRGVAEPLPAGVWLRPDVDQGVLTTGRNRLAATLPCLPDTPLIVLGVCDAADLDIADVAAFWRTLPPNLAASARFVQYGGLTLPHGATFGQHLADALGMEICAYTGIPTGTPDKLDVLALRQDGSLGASAFAQAFAYRPGGPATGRLCAHRAPLDGLGEVAPGVYWYAPDVVVEVVRAGLWLRPAEQITDPTGVRAAPLDPPHSLLLYEATDPARADRLAEVAAELRDRLDEETRSATLLMPSTALAGAPSGVTRPAAPLPVEPSPPVVEVQDPPAEPVDAGGTDDTDDTDLPWLSRLMETVSIPAPARPSRVEVQDDGARGTR